MRICRIGTPLRLRSTWSRLSAIGRPTRRLLALLFRVPWYVGPAPHTQQLSPHELRAYPDKVLERQNGIRLLRGVPLFLWRDTPLASLYRLYEDVCAGQLNMLNRETEYFFYRKEARWALKRVPDPQDPDPERYAVLAGLVAALVQSFNWRLNLGLRRDSSEPYLQPGWKRSEAVWEPEEAPEWIGKVAKLHEMLDLCVDVDERLGPQHAKAFLQYNVLFETGEMYTV